MLRRTRAWVRALSIATLVAGAACTSEPTTTLLPSAGRLIGRVELVGGVPLSTCRIEVSGTSRVGTCDGAGNFNIGNVPASPQPRELRIIEQRDKPGLAVVSRIISAAVNAGFVSDVGSIVLSAPGSIGGRVKVGTGKVPFALVAVPRYGAVTAVNDNGGYLLPNVPAGRHTVVLTSEGGDAEVVDVDVLPKKITKGVDFDLSNLRKRTIEISGLALREGRGAKENGGLVVELVEIIDGQVVQSATSSETGAFALQAASGHYQLRAHEPQSKLVATLPYLLVYGEEPLVLGYPIVVPKENGDLDGDGVNDDKDDDIDGDGVPNDKDAFPFDPSEFADKDDDKVGDRSDLKSNGGESIDNKVPVVDTDGDGLFDFEDNCQDVKNTAQGDSDGDEVGDVCDNCPNVANADQRDSVGDGQGDVCRQCENGTPCTPANACSQGKLTCTVNGAICADLQLPKANGTSCGSGQVCNNGSCGPCVAGEACAPTAAPCSKGTVSCASGIAECIDEKTPASDGATCALDKVCSAGVCIDCQSGAPCAPSTLCRQGKLSCVSGKPVCIAASAPVPDGTSCGSQLICQAGSCVPCNEGGPCQPTGQPCHVGKLSCQSGSPLCVDTGQPAADGTACPTAGQFCQAGACTTSPNTLTVVQGDQQTAVAGTALTPVVLELKDGGGTPLIGEQITFLAPPGASAQPPSALTNSSGRVTVTLTLAPSAGAQSFTVLCASAAPRTLAATATALPSGKVRTEVNVDHTAGDSGVPGPASAARIGAPSGIAVASDGTLYFSDLGMARVRKVTPAGQLENIAGTGSKGFSGDFGPALDAKLNTPTDLVVDAANKRLFVADYGNARVRMIDLAASTPIISTFAGGGTAPAPGYGDGGPATAAYLQARRIALAPDGSLYIADALHQRIRRVDPTTQIITTVLDKGCPADGGLGLSSCTNEGRCAMAFDAQGALFVVGYLCGEGLPQNNIGVLRRDPNGSLHHVAGRLAGVDADGSDARNTLFDPTRISFDSAGNLLITEGTKHRVRRIDARSWLVSTLVGTGSAGSAPELGDANAVALNDPRLAIFTSGDLLISEAGNFCIRRIPGLDLSASTAVALALSQGSNQGLAPTQLSAPLVVTATANGQPLSGVNIAFSTSDGSVSLSTRSATTAADGKAAITARPGLAVGSYPLQASLDDMHGTPSTNSPVTFAMQATAPAAETIFTAVNVDGQGGFIANPVAATDAKLNGPRSVAVAADGTIYLASGTQLLRISQGRLTLLGGDFGGFSGDTGPVSQASFSGIQALALDEPRNRLYVSDGLNNRVRMVDLTSMIVTTVVGGGAAGAPTYGDGGLATQAALMQPHGLAVSASGVLYLADSGHDRIRRVDPVTGLITTHVAGNASCGGPLALNYCSSCWLAEDAASTGYYLAGQICGGGVGTAHGILHVDAAGALTHVAGKNGGQSSDGTLATEYAFSGNAVYGLTVRGSSLYAAFGHRVIAWPLAGGAVTSIAGTSTQGSSGDFGPASAALLANVTGLGATPDGHLLIVDSGNNKLRLVW